MILFSRLSPEAQRLIVDAASGRYDNAPAPEIPVHIEDEIRMWVLSDESDCVPPSLN